MLAFASTAAYPARLLDRPARSRVDRGVPPDALFDRHIAAHVQARLAVLYGVVGATVGALWILSTLATFAAHRADAVARLGSPSRLGHVATALALLLAAALCRRRAPSSRHALASLDLAATFLVSVSAPANVAAAPRACTPSSCRSSAPPP